MDAEFFSRWTAAGRGTAVQYLERALDCISRILVVRANRDPTTGQSAPIFRRSRPTAASVLNFTGRNLALPHQLEKTLSHKPDSWSAIDGGQEIEQR